MKSADVPDVAGGSRNHRNILLSKGNSTKSTSKSEAIATAKDSALGRTTRSSRLRGLSRTAVNYDENEVANFDNLISMFSLVIGY